MILCEQLKLKERAAARSYIKTFCPLLVKTVIF